MKLWKTPVAEVRWCKLLEPAPQFDEAKPLAYSCELLMPVGSKEALEMEAMLEEIFAEVHEHDAKRNQYGMPVREDKDSKEIQVFKFKLEDRTFEARSPGAEAKRTEAPLILDEYGNTASAGSLIAFAIITETVFQWPGMGFLFIQAVQFADIPVMAAYLCLISLIFVVINLGVDLLYFAVDPRLRVEGKAH